MPYSRESAGNPSSTLASTVSRPWSCSVYARILWPRPMPATLVAAQVHDDAGALLGDELHRGVELQAAVAAHRPEHVAGEALGVHAHEHVLLARDLAAHERHVLGAVEQRLEHVAGEVAVAGRDARLGDPAHQLLAVAAVADEVGDRDELQAVLRGERLEPRHARHGAVVVDDLGQHPGRLQPGQAGEVDRGLGVAGALEHAALAVAQREDVAGPGEVFGPGGVVEDARARSWPRSAAEMPVVVPWRASTDTVNAVRWLSVLSATISGQAQLVEPRALRRACRSRRWCGGS